LTNTLTLLPLLNLDNIAKRHHFWRNWIVSKILYYRFTCKRLSKKDV